jgi:2-iminobutanoate/2-iminopropanoate deaminase
MEIQFRAIRPGFSTERSEVTTGHAQLGHEPEGVRAGPLLWISGQMAADERGALPFGDITEELNHDFDRIEAICEAAGTHMSNLLRLRAYLANPNDGYALYRILKERVPSDPPCVCVAGVPGPLQVPGCHAIVDAVAYVPEGSSAVAKR